MKRFLLKIVEYSLCLLAIGIALVFLLPDRYSRSSHEANVRLASERIAETNEPKIVIIGGSGCQFGFTSGLLAEHFNRPVINTGTHACLGLQLQINLFRDRLLPGDIVLLIPEYDQYSVPVLFLGCIDESMLRIMLSNYPRGLCKLTPEQWRRSIPLLPQYISKALMHFDAQADPWSPYSAVSINEYGDETNWENRPAMYQNNPHIEPIVNAPDPMILDFIAGFVAQCKKDGIALFLFPPALAQSEYTFNNAFIETLGVALEQKGIPYCVPSSRYCLPDSLFFDSYYHMTYNGARTHTQMVIHDLDSLFSLTHK